MIVNIKTLNNDILRIEVGPTDLVIDAKQLICDKTQIGVARQRLIYRGRVLIDTDKLESYGITDGQTLHLVARPTRTETANDSNTESVPEASSSLLSSSGQTQQQVNQPEVVDLPNESPSNLEHIRQSLLTVNTILSTLHQDQSSNGAIFENFNSAGIKFYTGQWVDVKDTVSQWLEATILDVDHSNRRVFVHYNGW